VSRDWGIATIQEHIHWRKNGHAVWKVQWASCNIGGRYSGVTHLASEGMVYVRRYASGEYRYTDFLKKGGQPAGFAVRLIAGSGTFAQAQAVVEDYMRGQDAQRRLLGNTSRFFLSYALDEGTLCLACPPEAAARVRDRKRG